MRQSIKIPRILKINWTSELSISVVFNKQKQDIQKIIRLLQREKRFLIEPLKSLINIMVFEKILSYIV